MEHQDHRCSRKLFLIFSLSIILKGCSTDDQGKSDGGQTEVQVKEITEAFSNSGLGNKIKDLLDKRSEQSDDPDFETSFATLFGALNSLAVEMPDNFGFDVKLNGPPESHPLTSNVNAMRCLNNATQFRYFLHRVHDILQELREDSLEYVIDSKDTDQILDSRENNTSVDQDDNLDSHENNSSMTRDDKLDSREKTSNMKRNGNLDSREKTMNVNKKTNMDSRENNSSIDQDDNLDSHENNSTMTRDDKLDSREKTTSMKRNDNLDSREKTMNVNQKTNMDSRENNSSIDQDDNLDSHENNSSMTRDDKLDSREKTSNIKRNDNLDSREKAMNVNQKTNMDSRENNSSIDQDDNLDSGENNSSMARDDKLDSREKTSNMKRNDNLDSREKTMNVNQKTNMDSRENNSSIDQDDNLDSGENNSSMTRDDKLDSREKTTNMKRNDNLDSRENITSVDQDSNLDSREKTTNINLDKKLDSREKTSNLKRNDKLDSHEKNRNLNGNYNVDSRENNTSVDSDDSNDSRENNTSVIRDDNLDSQDLDDSKNNSTDDSMDNDSTTHSPNSKHDSTSSTTVTPYITKTEVNNQLVRMRRDTELMRYNLDDVLDKLQDDDVKCMSGFFNEGDKQFLCRRFAQRSSGVFAKITSAGTRCEDYLQDSNDKDVANENVAKNDDHKSRETTDDGVTGLTDDHKSRETTDDGVTGLTDDHKSRETKDDGALDDKSDERSLNASHDTSHEEKKNSAEPDDTSEDRDKNDENSNSHDDDDSTRQTEKASRRNRMDVSQQLAVLKLFQEKGSAEWSDDDVKNVLRLAPDVIDDDFLEELPEELFKLNLHRLGRLAAGPNGNPRLRYALRKRLHDRDFSKLTSDDIREVGSGILSLRLDQIKALDCRLFLDTNVHDILNDGDSLDVDSKEKVEEEDDDDNDDVKLVIEHRIKEAVRQSGVQRHQIGRAMQYLHRDLEFVQSMEPDDLLDVLDDIRDIEYDFDDAQTVLHRLVQSSRFPPAAEMSGYNLTHIGKLMRGMDVELLAHLKKESLEEALDDISDIDFDDLQVYQLLENMGITSDPKNYENMNAPQIRRLGKLFRGIPSDTIALMKDDAIEDVLDDLDDLDLNDALKKAILEKVRHDDKISPKFLNLDTFAKVVSLDDLEDFDDDDVKHYLNISSFIRWRPTQAALLAHKYISANGNQHLRPSNLAEMKMVALGLLPDDLDDMMETQDDVFEIADKLKNVHDDLTSGQIDELIENLKDLSDLDDKDVIIDESEAIKGAHLLAYLEPKLFQKLEFTRAGKMAFVSEVAKMSTHKMSRDHLNFLANEILEMLEDVDSSESQKKSEDYESRRLRSLGQIALGLTPSQINGFSGMAVIDNLDIFRTLALTKAQAKAVLDKVEEAEENWRCHVDLLIRVGPLLQHHDDPFSDECDMSYQKELLSSFSVVAKGLEKRREMIQKRLDEGFVKENDDATDDAGEKRLVAAMVSMVTQKLNVRKRRAISTANANLLTCDILIRLGKSAGLIDTQLLTFMPKEEVNRCLPQLGAISGWSHEALRALADKVKSVYSDVTSWSVKTVAAAGSIIAGLSPAEIQMLSGLNRVDILQSIGRHGKLSIKQLEAGFRQWFDLNNKNDTSDITGVELSSLSEFVCGLGPTEISKLKDNTFKRSLDTIGRSISCTHEQLQAYLNKALALYGFQINLWNPAIVAEMGYMLGALSDEQMKLLTAKQLALIPPKTIQMLPRNRIAAMTPAQLMVLSTNQANAVTAAQYGALTAEQQKIIGSKSTIEFVKKEDNSSGRISGNRNGVNRIGSYGFLTLIITVFACVLM